MTDDNPTPDPDPTPELEQEAPDPDTRYAVYDVTLQRFVGPVTRKRPGVRRVRDLVGDHDYEVRKV